MVSLILLLRFQGKAEMSLMWNFGKSLICINNTPNLSWTVFIIRSLGLGPFIAAASYNILTYHIYNPSCELIKGSPM